MNKALQFYNTWVNPLLRYSNVNNLRNHAGHTFSPNFAGSITELTRNTRGVAISSRRAISIVGWDKETDGPLIGWGRFDSVHHRVVTQPVVIVRSDGLFRFWVSGWERELAFKSINPTFLSWTWGAKGKNYHGLHLIDLEIPGRYYSPWLKNEAFAIYPATLFSPHIWYQASERDQIDVIEVVKIVDESAFTHSNNHLESQRMTFIRQYERCVNYSLKQRGIVFAELTQQNLDQSTRKQLANAVTKFSTERTHA